MKHIIVFKVIALSVLMVIVVNNGFSQDSTFLKTIRLEEPRSGRQLIKYQDRYFLLLSGICDNTIECSTVMEINKTGEVLWRKKLKWLDVTGKSMNIYNDTITITGNKQPELTSFLMHQMSLEGDSITTYIIKDHNRPFTRMFQLATIQRNGKYYIAGDGVMNDSSFALIYIVDHDGSLDTIISPIQTDWTANIWDLIFDSQGLLTAFIELDAKGKEEGFFDYRMIVKYDEDYNIVWSYTSEQDNANKEPKPRGTELKDGRIVYTLQGKNNFSGQYSLRAINKDSTISWWYNWPDNNDIRRRIYGIKTLANGDIIGVGEGSVEENDPTILISPFICRLSPDGELLWERYLVIQDSLKKDVTVKGDFFDVLELDNGSLYAIGYWWGHGAKFREVLLLHLDSDGCLVPDCTYNMTTDTIYCKVEKPVIKIVDDFLICLDQNLEYRWLDCDDDYAEIEEVIGRIFQPEKSGKYAIKVSLETCVDTSDCIDFIHSSTEDYKLESIKIFPNPLNDNTLNVVIPKQIKNDDSVCEIRDIFGRLIYKRNIVNGINELNISNLARSIYTVNIKKKGINIYSCKIIY